MFRSVLAAIKPVIEQDFLMDFVTALAAKQQWSVDFLSVIDAERLAPPEPVPAGGGAFKLEKDNYLIATARKCAASNVTSMGEKMRQTEVDWSAEIPDGDTLDLVAKAIQKCDLLICGHARGKTVREESFLTSLIKECARPVLVVPETKLQQGGPVLVAYDGSAQAVRALSTFVYSGLGQNREIHVLVVDDGADSFKLAAGAADAFLHRHDLKCNIHFIDQSNGIAGALLNEIQRYSPSLLVMGAFGRNLMREFFLGSVTRSLLRALPVPIFLNH